MADQLTYGQEQAERNLSYWQGMSGRMRKPSALASPEERAAFTAQEVRGGRAPEYALPESYGGMPVGTTRRAIRARQAWDAQQEYMAGLAKQQQEAQQAAREEQKFQLDYASKLYDFETKQNEDLFNSKIEADTKAAEAAFTKFRNSLDPNDPASSGMIYSYISSDPRLAESKIAYASADFFDKAAKNSATSIALKQQENFNSARSEALRAGVSEDAINKVLIEAKDRDEQGNEFTNINKALAGITKLTDTTIGKRAIKEEEKKEERGEYRPMSIEQAQDEFDVAQAEFGAIQEAGLDEEDPDFAKAQSRLRRAEAQLAVSKKRSPAEQQTKTEAPQVPKITSKEEFDNLPSGSEYIAPNGKRYRKK